MSQHVSTAQLRAIATCPNVYLLLSSEELPHVPTCISSSAQRHWAIKFLLIWPQQQHILHSFPLLELCFITLLNSDTFSILFKHIGMHITTAEWMMYTCSAAGWAHSETCRPLTCWLLHCALEYVRIWQQRTSRRVCACRNPTAPVARVHLQRTQWSFPPSLNLEIYQVLSYTIRI